VAAGRHIYLAKASDDLVSHCRCETALVALPGQLDCPWCGCGWLFSCVDCRKAFTFAQAIEVDEPWDALARRDLRRRANREPDDLEVRRWVNWMRELLADVELGERYVYLDGELFRSDVSALAFDGWYARHELELLPQVAALADPQVLAALLTNREYWLARRLPGKGDGG